VRASDTLARRLFASGRGEDAFVVPELVEDPFMVCTLDDNRSSTK
jgi:hypothetical protein